jgi:protein-disulfide isomerase
MDNETGVRPNVEPGQKGKKDNFLWTTKFLAVIGIVQVVLLALIVLQIFGVLGEQTTTGAAVAEPKEEEPVIVDLSKIISDDDSYLGPKDAEIVIVEFSDFECPYCGAATGDHKELMARFKGMDPSWTPSVPELKKLAKSGKIKLVFKHFPLSFHQNAQKAAEAAECAGDQGKFWEMHDQLYANQETLSVDNYKKWAGELGLDTAKFNTCLDQGQKTAKVQKDFTVGQQAGVQGTPAFFVNGLLISGAQPFSVFEQVIAAAGQ